MIRWLRTSQLARANRQEASRAGYTITETLIVLAVTTMMFAAIVVSFSGRQARTEFTQAVRDFESRIESVISEVVNGHYQSFGCSVVAISPPTVSTTPSANPASNVGCVFVGKTLQPQNGNPKVTQVLTLAGRRESVAGKDVENLAEALPVIASAANYTNTFQLELRRIVGLGDGVPKQAISFIRSFSKPAGSTGGGSSDGVDLLVHNIAISASTNALFPTSPVNSNNQHSGVVLCLLGQNGQRAEITVGADGSPGSLVSTLDTTNAGACLNA